MDNRIKNVFPEGLPEGVTATYVSIGGTPALVFKKDGKTLDQAQLKNEVINAKAENYFKDDEQLKVWENALKDLSSENILEDSIKQIEGMDDEVLMQKMQKEADKEKLTNGISSYKSVIRNWQDYQNIKFDGKSYATCTINNKKYYACDGKIYSVGLNGKPDKEVKISDEERTSLINNMLDIYE